MSIQLCWYCGRKLRGHGVACVIDGHLRRVHKQCVPGGMMEAHWADKEHKMPTNEEFRAEVDEDMRGKP